nr:MAG TPA: hypothetical protein [Caudoviricetes sp.]
MCGKAVNGRFSVGSDMLPLSADIIQSIRSHKSTNLQP